VYTTMLLPKVCHPTGFHLIIGTMSLPKSGPILCTNSKHMRVKYVDADVCHCLQLFAYTVVGEQRRNHNCVDAGAEAFAEAIVEAVDDGEPCQDFAKHDIGNSNNSKQKH
jgi:hypothetical protein